MSVQPLEDLVAELRRANKDLLPGSRMLAVSTRGAYVVGLLLPSGRVLGPGGVEIEAVWSCEVKAAINVIGRLEEVLEQCKLSKKS